jgi:hypothetical protein
MDREGDNIRGGVPPLPRRAKDARRGHVQEEAQPLTQREFDLVCVRAAQELRISGELLQLYTLFRAQTGALLRQRHGGSATACVATLRAVTAHRALVAAPLAVGEAPPPASTLEAKLARLQRLALVSLMMTTTTATTAAQKLARTW